MIKICKFCNKSFDAHENKVKFCSHLCYSTSTRGKPAWNKGKKRWWKSPTEFKKGHNLGVRFGRDKDTHGSNNNRWKGGIKYVNGYKFISMPNHPFANNQGYVREHKLTVEKIIKRFLLPTEVIHHINKIKDDNRPENLYLFSSNSEHRKYEGLKNKSILKSNIQA